MAGSTGGQEAAKRGQWVQDVLSFWFEELKQKDWFASDPALDARISERFGSRLTALSSAREPVVEPLEALATVIVLDQFSRNIYRGNAGAFGNDPRAVAVASAIIDSGRSRELSSQHQYFLFMPFMHSERLVDQKRAVTLFHEIGDDNGVKWAKKHLDIIEEYGRFPHRNQVLGRESTAAEVAYLKTADTFGQAAASS